MAFLIPGLHAIEIVWEYMKDRVATCRPRITEVNDFKSILIEEWESVLQEKINALIDSIPAHIKVCIKDHGGNNFNY